MYTLTSEAISFCKGLCVACVCSYEREGETVCVCVCVYVCVCVCYLLPGQVCGTLHTMEENIRAVTKEKRTR